MDWPLRPLAIPGPVVVKHLRRFEIRRTALARSRLFRELGTNPSPLEPGCNALRCSSKFRLASPERARCGRQGRRRLLTGWILPPVWPEELAASSRKLRGWAKTRVVPAEESPDVSRCGGLFPAHGDSARMSSTAYYTWDSPGSLAGKW